MSNTHFSDEFDFENRIMDTNEIPEDVSEGDNPLRPKNLDEYIGQDKAKDNLRVYIEAAKIRHETLDHVLLYGPPGLGKTTLAGIIANELGVNIRITSGPAIEKPGDLAALLTNLNEGDVLFIDEIHRLSRAVEEVLYPSMEDFAIDIITGKGQMAASYHLPLPRFTLERSREWIQLWPAFSAMYRNRRFTLIDVHFSSSCWTRAGRSVVIISMT